MVPPPIIRSTHNFIYSIWYLSHLYRYLPLSWRSWNCVTVWKIPDAVDTVVCAPDDGWKYHPKHVEQFPYINKLCKVASFWNIFTIFTMHGPITVKSTKNYFGCHLCSAHRRKIYNHMSVWLRITCEKLLLLLQYPGFSDAEGVGGERRGRGRGRYTNWIPVVQSLDWFHEDANTYRICSLEPITIFHWQYILREDSPCHHKKWQGLESETA